MTAIDLLFIGVPFIVIGMLISELINWYLGD